MIPLITVLFLFINLSYILVKQLIRPKEDLLN
jgi:hypothetical protein